MDQLIKDTWLYTDKNHFNMLREMGQGLEQLVLFFAPRHTSYYHILLCQAMLHLQVSYYGFIDQIKILHRYSVENHIKMFLRNAHPDEGIF